MKLLLLAGFSCCLLQARSQYSPATADLIKRSMELLEKGDYRNTIPVAEQALAAVKKEAGEKDPVNKNLYSLLGTCHFGLGEYTEAETSFLQLKKLLVQTNNTSSSDYVECLSNLGFLYREMARYHESVTLYLQALETVRKIKGMNSTDEAILSINLGSLFQSLNEYKKSEQYYTSGTRLLHDRKGENSIEYATCLNNLATLYLDLARYNEAIGLCEKAVSIRKKILGDSDPAYAEALTNLANTKVASGKFTDAEKQYREVLEIFKKSPGENSADYATGLNNLAYYYQLMGHYEPAEKLYKESCEICKRTQGETHPDYATSLVNLASLVADAGQYEKALEYYEAAATIYKNALGDQHLQYAVSLNNMGNVYANLGTYDKAEALYLQSSSLKKKILGPVHPDYAISLNNLASFYLGLGQTEKAQLLFGEAIAIIKKTKGDQNRDYARYLDNLAGAWQQSGQFSRAEKAYHEALAVKKSLFGENHPEYAVILNNLATLYSETGQQSKAIPLLVQAKNIWKKISGGNNAAYATSLNNLATCYRKSHTNYDKALLLHEESLRLRKTILGEQHPDYARNLCELALLYTQQNEWKKASPLYKAGSRALLQHISGTFSILSEKEKALLLESNREVIDYNHSYLLTNPQKDEEIRVNNYNLELGFKSLALASTRITLEQVRKSPDTSLQHLLDRLLITKNMLSKLYGSPGQTGTITELESRAEMLEKELERRSAIFNNQQKALHIRFQDVQNNLAADEAAVEFVKFRFFHNGWSDSIYYGAYVIRKNDTAPQFVFLCEAKQIDSLFRAAGGSAGRMAKVLYQAPGTAAGESRAGQRLYQLIWSPLEPLLKNIHTVSYSPAGSLYGIAFEALPADSGHYLLERYQLRQYTSTRQVASRTGSETASKPAGILLMGNALFSMDSMQLLSHRQPSSDSGLTGSSGFFALSRGRENRQWPPLPGTNEEINKIALLFDQNHIPRQVYLQADASEENLKKNGTGKTSVLHIATHGFFLPEKEKKTPGSQNPFTVLKDPLLRTGLVLAGANYTWGGKTPVKGVEDGILTAYEIAQLDFSSTELVVLSACETGLGDIRGAEGVFGLQRAFKIAGAKKLIVSLWQVPDKETAELMETFYSNWLQGSTIDEAFRLAKTAMQKKYPPWYWAAFVLVE